MLVTLIFISFLLCHVRGLGRVVSFPSFSFSLLASLVLMTPCGPGGVRAHPCARTRTGGTARARHPLPEIVPALAGKDAAAHPRWTPRNRFPAALAGAWTPSAASYEAGARSLQPTALKEPIGSRSPAD